MTKLSTAEFLLKAYDATSTVFRNNGFVVIQS